MLRVWSIMASRPAFSVDLGVGPVADEFLVDQLIGSLVVPMPQFRSQRR